MSRMERCFPQPTVTMITSTLDSTVHVKWTVSLILIVFAIHATASAAELSQATNGVYLAIGGDSGHARIEWDERLLFKVFPVTELAESERVALTYPNHVYGMQVRMRDSDGKEVKKTQLGEQAGSKADLLKKADFQQVVKEVGIWNMYAYGRPFRDESDMGGAQFLPKPSELFAMDVPGAYTMEIKVQMYRLNRSNWTRTVFEFPSVTVKVERPPGK